MKDINQPVSGYINNTSMTDIYDSERVSQSLKQFAVTKFCTKIFCILSKDDILVTAGPERKVCSRTTLLPGKLFSTPASSNINTTTVYPETNLVNHNEQWLRVNYWEKLELRGNFIGSPNEISIDSSFYQLNKDDVFALGQFQRLKQFKICKISGYALVRPFLYLDHFHIFDLFCTSTHRLYFDLNVTST